MPNYGPILYYFRDLCSLAQLSRVWLTASNGIQERIYWLQHKQVAKYLTTHY